jgi:hypothetical protein
MHVPPIQIFCPNMDECRQMEEIKCKLEQIQIDLNHCTSDDSTLAADLHSIAERLCKLSGEIEAEKSRFNELAIKFSCRFDKIDEKLKGINFTGIEHKIDDVDKRITGIEHKVSEGVTYLSFWMLVLGLVVTILLLIFLIVVILLLGQASLSAERNFGHLREMLARSSCGCGGKTGSQAGPCSQQPVCPPYPQPPQTGPQNPNPDLCRCECFPLAPASGSTTQNQGSSASQTGKSPCDFQPQSNPGGPGSGSQKSAFAFICGPKADFTDGVKSDIEKVIPVVLKKVSLTNIVADPQGNQQPFQDEFRKQLATMSKTKNPNQYAVQLTLIPNCGIQS